MTNATNAPPAPGLGRRHDAEIEPADDAEDQDPDRPHLGQRTPPLTPGDGLLERRRQLGTQLAAHDDHRGVDQRGHKPGQDAGDEQLGNRNLGEDAVEHEADRRRDHRPQRSGAGDDAGRQPLVVAVARHLGDGDAAHGRGGGDRRAGGGRKPRAGEVGGDREPARQSAEPHTPGAEQRRADARMVGHRAHQQEHRDRRKRPMGGEVEGLGLQHAGGHAPALELADADHGDQQQGQPDRKPEHDQHQQRAERPETEIERRHEDRPRATRNDSAMR